MSTSLNDDDMVLLESLIRSPAFTLIKKITKMYRDEALSQLTSSTDTHMIYRSQGRVISLNAVDNLGLLVQEWRNRQEIAGKQAQEKADREERVKPKPDRKLPPRRG